MSEIEVVIKKEELRDKLGIVEETAELTRDRLESLEGDERLDKKAVKGIDKLEKRIEEVAQLPRGGGMTKGAADMYYTTLAGVSKTPTYNSDGTLHTITDANGTKEAVYNSDGTLAQLIGTGAYRTKTLSWSGGVWTGTIVS